MKRILTVALLLPSSLNAQPLPGPTLPTQITQPGQLQIVPRARMDLSLPSGPCFDVLQARGVIINLTAQATSPSVVALSWSGPPGVYRVSATGGGTAFSASTTLRPLETLSIRRPQDSVVTTSKATSSSEKSTVTSAEAVGAGLLQGPSAPQVLAGTLTHGSASPNTQYSYTIRATLDDGRPACGNAVAMTPAKPPEKEPPTPLFGWVDLHTHPMSNLAFGGKLFHGAPDIGSLMPAVQMPNESQCRFDQRATSMDEALSNDGPTRGSVGAPTTTPCGNAARFGLIRALESSAGANSPDLGVGAPSFADWPKWSDITHQKMWVEWIRRAKDGGLRVMVALSHNNRLLAEVADTGKASEKVAPISSVKNDKASSDLQVKEIAALVARHHDFMEVAKSSADLHRIVKAGKLAVVLGVEIDNIGDFRVGAPPTTKEIEKEIDRLYDELDVRYIFPVHVTDNVFGDTAIYSPLFNAANFRDTGALWTVGCAERQAAIGFDAMDLPNALKAHIKLLPAQFQPPPCKTSGKFLGHVNVRTEPTRINPFGGLTERGEFALKHMMKRGMLIDVDHMSQRAVNRALEFAKWIPNGGYPLISGHNGLRPPQRDDREPTQENSENSRTELQLKKIACLGGMFGLGTDALMAENWAQDYLKASNIMMTASTECPGWTPFGPGIVAFGTDTNSLVRTPMPPYRRAADIYTPDPRAHDNPGLPFQQKSIKSGTQTWDYNRDGVAHYGMFADFVKDVRSLPPNFGIDGRELVDRRLTRSADYFYHVWKRVEEQKANARGSLPVP